MARVDTNSACAQLLERCAARDPHLIVRLALVAGVAAGRLEGCRAHASRLDPHEQQRLADAVARRVPELAREARHLSAQAASAERFAAAGSSVFSATGAPSTARQPGPTGRARRYSRAE